MIEHQAGFFCSINDLNHITHKAFFLTLSRLYLRAIFSKGPFPKNLWPMG